MRTCCPVDSQSICKSCRPSPPAFQTRTVGLFYILIDCLEISHDKRAHLGLVSRMSLWPSVLFTGALMAGLAAAQVVPAHPHKFTNRRIGGTSIGGFEVQPKNGGTPKMVRYTTHIVLSVDRFWTSTEGKLIQGKLMAFEDTVTEASKGAEPSANPAPPDTPTVVRDGNIRLLIKNKPVVIPLSRFSTGDLDFVEQVRKAYTKKAASNP